MESQAVLEVLEELSDDENFLDLIKASLEGERVITPKYESFSQWNDLDFLQRFRISKASADFLLSKIRNQLPQRGDRRGSPISHEDMFLSTLSFYASGEFMRKCGDSHGFSKASICRNIHVVSEAIARLREDFASLPDEPEEIDAANKRFFNIAKFPHCIGAIDCTHVKLQSSGGNRKFFFTMKLQTISDADLRIQDIVARWPGATLDNTIFENSRVKRRFESGEFDDSVIVGDKGFELQRYLITPIRNPQNEVDDLFNASLSKTRSAVEKCNSIWKRRFPILCNGLRVRLKNVQAIIVATAVLHNIAIVFKDDMPIVNRETEQHIAKMDARIDDEEEADEDEGSNFREPFLQYFRDLSREHGKQNLLNCQNPG